jgi:hypothetical protein
MTTFTSNNNDGIWWAILQPKLSPLDPSNPASQTVAPPIIEDNAVWNASDSSVDFFNPTFVGTGQGDGDLVYNVSGVSQFPGVVYTALRASDTPNTLGGLAASSKVVKAGSTVDNSFNWNNYFTCSLDTNLTSRGLVWCGGEYGAGQSDTGGWDTRIFALQN